MRVALQDHCTVLLQYFEVALQVLSFKQNPALLRFFKKYVYSHQFKKTKNPNSILEECNTQSLSASLWFLIGFFIVIIIIGFFLKRVGRVFYFLL